MKDPHLVSYNVMLAMYLRIGEIILTSQLFDNMTQRDLISRNTLLNGDTLLPHGALSTGLRHGALCFKYRDDSSCFTEDGIGVSWHQRKEISMKGGRCMRGVIPVDEGLSEGNGDMMNEEKVWGGWLEERKEREGGEM
ncbi:hypothetical protein L1887_15166 [Cichorium endivia]|nr:hypothetical protein L1887_15166 [Cichorium endivia]